MNPFLETIMKNWHVFSKINEQQISACVSILWIYKFVLENHMHDYNWKCHLMNIAWYLMLYDLFSMLCSRYTILDILATCYSILDALHFIYISYTSHLMIDDRYLKRQKEKGRGGMHKKWEKGRKKYRENTGKERKSEKRKTKEGVQKELDL